jgi:phosphate/sulfate permease
MDALLSLPVLIGLIAVALAFDFLNGLHDAANSIATIVSTRVLRPRYAVVWAAFFNFIAFLFFGLHVAHRRCVDHHTSSFRRHRGDVLPAERNMRGLTKPARDLA